MLKKYTNFCCLLILFSSTDFGMHPLQRQAFNNNTSRHEDVYSTHSSNENDDSVQQEQDQKKAQEEAERKRLAELRSRLEAALLEERLQQEDSEKEKLKAEIHDGLALLHSKQEKRAIAIFQIPDQSKIYNLTDQEKDRIKELFKVYSVENHGEYKVVKFKFKNVDLLPQNQEQAIYLLYSPYVKTKLPQHSTLLSPLNEPQKEALEKQKDKKETIKLQANIASINEIKKRVETRLKRQEGLFGTTKVKTQTGYCSIEELKVGDLVACYDFKNKREVFNSITYADKLHLLSHIQIILNDDVLQVAPEHKFYISSTNSWIRAKDLVDHPGLRALLDTRIQDSKEVAEELDVIRISVNNQQNYYITNNNLLVHNFLLLDVSILWGIGEGIEITWAVLGPTLTAAATSLIYWVAGQLCHVEKIPHANSAPQQFWGKHPEANNPNSDIFFKAENNTPTPQNTPKNNPGQPNKDPEKEQKNNEYITTKEATEAAEKLGFQKIKEQSEGRPVYKNGNRYITPDRNRHNGGFWKMSNSVEGLKSRETRMGTYDVNLTRIGN